LAVVVAVVLAVEKPTEPVKVYSEPCGTLQTIITPDTQFKTVGSRSVRCEKSESVATWMLINSNGVRGWINNEEFEERYSSSNSQPASSQSSAQSSASSAQSSQSSASSAQSSQSSAQSSAQSTASQTSSMSTGSQTTSSATTSASTGSDGGSGYNNQALVDFANNNWNCAQAACTSKVTSGTFQPNYECAEFVARSLAAGGYIPNLTPGAAQSAYGSYKYQGTTYDLLWVSSKQGPPLGLSDFLTKIGWRNVGTSSSNIGVGSVVVCHGSNGAWGHVVVGVGSNLVDAHNSARYHVSGTYYSITAIYNPPN